LPCGLREWHQRRREDLAVDAVASACQPHHFLAVTKDGRSAIATTTGNQICHITLCGGTRSNYGAASVEAACGLARQSGLTPVVIIDASHANSVKDPEN